MLKKQLKIEEITKVVERLQGDLSMAMKSGYGEPTVEIAVVTAYLVYKVRTNGKYIGSYDYIKSNECTESDNLRLLIDKNFSREIWDEITERISEDKYTDTQLLSVVFEDALLEKFSSTGRISETPESLAKLALRILDVKKGEQVADICSGLGTFISQGLDTQPEGEFTGYERDFYTACVCEMRLDLLGKAALIENVDALELFKKSHRMSVEKIFSNYPFGLRLRTMPDTGWISELLMGKYKGIKTTTSSDWIYNTLVGELLAENGRAVCLMSRGSTWNSQDREMRQYFVEKGLIECVISLPERLFPDTAIATSMIVISWGNSRDVRMVDGSQFFERGRRFNWLSNENIEAILSGMGEDSQYSQIISYETLRENDFTLNSTRYLKDKIEFENEVPFKEIIKEIRRGAPLKASELDKMTTDEKTDVQYLMLSNVQDGEIAEQLPFLKDVDSKYEKYCLQDGDLIISRNHSPYKVGVCKVPEGRKIIANGNIYVVTLDESKVDPYYILAFFNSQAGNLALKSISVGTVITNISIKDLKELGVPVPAMDVQRAVAMSYRKKMAQVKKLRGKLAAAERELGEVFDMGL